MGIHIGQEGTWGEGMKGHAGGDGAMLMVRNKGKFYWINQADVMGGGCSVGYTAWACTLARGVHGYIGEGGPIEWRGLQARPFST